ncbi:BRCT domain-containing protein, partial [Drosera capensis]
DDPVCVAASKDGKTLVSSLWVDHSLKANKPIDASFIVYQPVKDLNGIPGAKDFVVCLTGYQRNDRDDIMTLVSLMGAQFSKPLVANKVTHLICYKFEGEKYELAKRLKRIKLVNHSWLEDCLKEWKLLPEEDYSKSGYELEMETVAKDSYDEPPDFGASLVSGASIHLQNKLPAAQNASVIKGMLQNVEPLPSSNTGGNKEVTPPIKPELKSDQANGPYDSVDPLDTKCQKIGVAITKTDNLVDQHVTAPVLKPATSDHPSSSGNAKKLPDNRADKLYAVSYSRKTPRRSRLSLGEASEIGTFNGCLSEGKYGPGACTAISRDERGKGIATSMSLEATSTGVALADEVGPNPSLAPKRKLNDGTDLSPSTSKFQKLNSSAKKTIDARHTQVPLHGSFEMRKCTSVVDPCFVPGTDVPVTCDFAQKPPSDHEIGSAVSNLPTSRSLHSELESGNTNVGCGKSRSSAVSTTSIVKATEKSKDQRQDQHSVVSSHLKNPELMKSKSLNTTRVHDVSLKTFTRKTSAKKLGSTPKSNTSSIDLQKIPVCLSGMSPSKKASSPPVPDVMAADNVKFATAPRAETTAAHDNADSVARLPMDDGLQTANKGKGTPTEHSRNGSVGHTAYYKPEVHISAAPENGKGTTEIEHEVRVGNENPWPRSSVYQRDPRRKKSAKGKILISIEMEKHHPASVKVPEPDSSVCMKKVEVKKISETQGVGKRVLDSLCNVSHGTTPVKKLQPTGGHAMDAAKRHPSWFIVSGHRLRRKEFQQVIKKLKGRLCRDAHKWSYQATHFIVPDPVRRTEKFFAALASGSWVLKPDYLSASYEAGKFLAEEPYEWHKNSLSADGAINLEAPRKWRLLKERTGHGALFGMHIVIYGDCIAPTLDTLKRVVKAGMPHGDEWIQEFLQHEIPCVLADYLVDYVCKPGYPLEKHVLYNTQSWAAKSFGRLVSRSDEVVE